MASTTQPADLRRYTATLAADLEQTRRNVTALGDAIHAAHLTASPALARAVQVQQNLYDRIAEEFGLLTSAQAADRIGSRAITRRNAASAARNERRLVALRRGRYLLYPAFQFDAAGIRTVMAELLAVAAEYDWDDSSLIEWLVSPTTYLGGQRPVDHLDEPQRVLATARAAFGVSW